MKTKIRTLYVPATDTTGSRVKATGNGRTRSIPYPHELSGPAVGKAAATAFCDAFGLNPETLREVNTPTGKRGYTFTVEGFPSPVVYVNRKGGGYRETVDQFATRKEARDILKEYRMADPSGDFWLSSRPIH